MTTRYQQQLDFVFQRPITNPAWYWSHDETIENPFGEEEDAMRAFLFYQQLCRQPGRDLANYTDAQLGQGLTYLFDGSVSNIVFGFKAADVSVEEKAAALRSLSVLFKEVFVPRCPPVLSAFSQEPISPMKYICYMFWDVTPLSQWPAITKADRRTYYDAIAWVMEQCLYMPNPAVVESGLHGLGHMVFDYPAVATPIIDAYLAKNKKSEGHLMNYARSARTGMIQ
jgi:hypothetical protein